MAVRTYIRAVYVAVTEFGKPILTAYTQEDLKAGLDEYYGESSKCLGFEYYDSKYPDEYEGYYEYEYTMGISDREDKPTIYNDIIKVYCLNLYPETRYEAEV